MENMEQWNKLRNDYFLKTKKLSDYLQSLSVDDLADTDVSRKVSSLRYELTLANTHLFQFAQNQNWTHFRTRMNRE